MVAQPSLRELAQPWPQADVARITGLTEPTLSRLWDDPDWLDKVKGATLQALISGIPGIGSFVIDTSLLERRSPIFDAVQAVGLRVDTVTYQHICRPGAIPEQHVMSALETAVAVMQGNVRRATNLLATYWNLEEDHALAAIYAPPDRD